MEILRFRTSANSPWVEITAIKGDKGDSYVLTEEDKKEIAGMVDVGDVDVNLSDYALKTDLEPLMTEAETQALIDASLSKITNGNEVSY